MTFRPNAFPAGLSQTQLVTIPMSAIQSSDLQGQAKREPLMIITVPTLANAS